MHAGGGRGLLEIRLDRRKERNATPNPLQIQPKLCTAAPVGTALLKDTTTYPAIEGTKFRSVNYTRWRGDYGKTASTEI
jgi:hypothetical protein